MQAIQPTVVFNTGGNWQKQYTGGYLDFPRLNKNDQNESKSEGIRLSLEYDITDNANILFRYDHQETESTGISFGPYKFQKSLRDELEAEY